MNELSLFTGVGGGLLGTKLLGFDHIGYVEINEYCQRIIAQRIKDGILDEAPIFGDIRTFISEGYAESYQGMVDVITAGFPCQPFSVAGKRQGEDDERNMWPATIDVIRTVRPRFALLENVPGLLAHEYARTIFRDLAESGFDARWDILGASDVGAPHRRKRVWIVAYSKCMRQLQQEGGEQDKRGWISDGSENVANSKRIGCNEMEQSIKKRTGGERAASEVKYGSSSGRGEWWCFEPNVGRVADGIPFRVDRLKALGNAQVSRVVATAWRILNESK